ncbi:MAG: hypothetical protein DMG57_07750, partial [Acidobacteria bacterium]
MKPWSYSIGLLILAALISAPAFTQPPPPGPAAAPQPSVKTTTEEVLLDIVVRDKKGRPITDLKPEDVTVSDNGVQQTLTSFRLVKGAEAINQTNAATPLDPLRQARLVTLAFEPLGEIDQRKMARAAAIDLINGEQGANVYYSIVVINTRLLVLQQFTKDKDALTAAIEKATGGYAGQKLMAESESIQSELRRQLGGQPGAEQSTTLLAAASQVASQNTSNGRPPAD